LAKYQEIVKIFFQYVAMLKELPPQEWIFEEQKGMADVDFKFKQKTPASRFTSKTSSVMQKPLPREWLLSGGSRLRTFEPALIAKALGKLRPDNLRLSIISRDFPGDWDQKEKWYGTQYKYEKIPNDFMEDLRKAAQTSASERVPELHLPHKNSFIPSKLEVEKKEVAEPALAPRLLRNDSSARTWWKKDDTFWVPQANVIVSLQTPILDLKAKTTALGRLYTELVRDALEEYSYDAELAGLQYSVGLESRGLWLDISGYNDKLLVLLDKVVQTLKNLEIKKDRFEIVKERLTRGYNNWQLQSSYQQVGDYMSWLTSERDNIVEMMAAELPSITSAEVSQFRDDSLKDMHIEVYVHGNMYRNDALKATNLVEATLNAGVVPPEKRLNPRSFVLPAGSNYVYNKTLQDPANVNHCVETFFHIGERGDREVRARTLLIDQMLHEPAFDQLRTKEQLGYVVFTGMRSLFTTCGIRFLIQSERTPQYLDTRIEAFLTRYGETLAEMSESEFEGHKRSVIVKRLEKLKNLNQESSRHWQQISNEFYDFEQGNAPRVMMFETVLIM
jgi:insulysin